MADYYSLVAKAVSALDLNTEKARRRLYERARTALRSRMHAAYPPFHRTEIAAAELSLEMAIDAVEAEAVGEQNAKFATAKKPKFSVSCIPPGPLSADCTISWLLRTPTLATFLPLVQSRGHR
jgi:hypothetical protein